MAVDVYGGPNLTVPAAPFDIEGYWEERAERPAFVMVEFGHSAWPIAFQQDFDFRCQTAEEYRLYFGVEAWLRDSVGLMRHTLAQTRHERQDGQTAFFINHDLGGTVRHDLYDADASWYEGPYKPQTCLPSGLANEVVASNVVGDPISAEQAAHVVGLFDEMSRVADDDATLVLREAITPHRTHFVCDEFLAAAGLWLKGFFTPASSTWSALEAKYKGDHTMPVVEDSYYAILGKLAAKPSAR